MVFALNYLVNYALLRGTAELGAGGRRRGRMALSAGAGAVYAAAVYLPHGGWLRLAPMKLLCAAVMLMIAFGLRKSTLRLAVVFAVLTLVLCGAVYGLELLKHGRVQLRGSDFFYPVSFSSVVLTAGGVWSACRLLLPRAEHAPESIAAVTLERGGKRVRLTALCDSGNTLRDPVTGEGVVVAHWTAVKTLFPALHLQPWELAAPDRLALRLKDCKPRLLPYRAVGTASALLVAVPCRLWIGKQVKNCLVALSPTPVSDGGAYEALIGGTIYAEISRASVDTTAAKAVKNHVHRRKRHSSATAARR